MTKIVGTIAGSILGHMRIKSIYRYSVKDLGPKGLDRVLLEPDEALPGAGAPFRLPAIVGDAWALELICSARPVDSSEMERIGLVNRVVPSDRLLEVLRDLAGTLAGNGPFALRGAKRIVRLRREDGEAAARKLAAELRQAFEWTADADEGVAASLQGRKPVFTGQ